jgi:hypothetical protein
MSHLLCRHDYEVVEHVGDRLEPGYGVADRRLDVNELRRMRCGKMRRVVRGEHLPLDTGEEAAGRRPTLPRR